MRRRTRRLPRFKPSTSNGGDGKVFIKKWESLHEMTEDGIKYVEAHRNNADLWQGVSHAFNNLPSREGFIGERFADMRAAQSKALKPWKEGVELIEKLLESIDVSQLPKPVSRRRRQTWREDIGDEFSYDRFKSGQACWQTTQRAHVSGKQTVTIVTNVSTSAFRTSESIMWRGAAALCLAKILEDAGYRVDLWVVQTVQGFTQRNEYEMGHFALNVKRPEDVLDIGSMAVAISGWFFRTFFFAAQLSTMCRNASSFGYPCENKPELIIDDDGSQMFKVSDVWDKYAAKTLIERTLKEFVEGQNVHC